jgi:hypothetical protein
MTTRLAKCVVYVLAPPREAALKEREWVIVQVSRSSAPSMAKVLGRGHGQR